MIDEHLDRHPGLKQDRALLESIPGVRPVISQQMVAFIRNRAFENAAQCAAFLGLVPVQHESGSRLRGRSHLSDVDNAKPRAPSSTWQQSWLLHKTRISGASIKAWSRVANPGSRHSAPRCASWYRFVLVCLNTRHLICLKQSEYLLCGCEADGIYRPNPQKHE